MRFFEGLQNISREKQILPLLVILTIGFLIRLWLLDKRWINPDEGAHLMDGRLVLDGLVPEVDYGSRQVLYVYTIALFLKIFGVSYLNVRFLPLISTMGIGLLVFFISKRLFNEKVALLASGIYMFLPLSITESAIVKTEPLTTLLSCTGIYLAILGVESKKRAALLFFLSGVFLSLAYYVRESSLAILVSIFLFFVITYWKRTRLLLKNYGMVLSGYICVCLIALAYYSQFMNTHQIWNSSINPLCIILQSLHSISSSFLPQARAATNSLNLSGGSESWNLTISYLNLTLFTHTFLFVGFIFSMFILAYSLLTKRNNGDFKELSLPFSLLYSWLFSLTLFYFYWMIHRGFFIEYFEEFLPPLAILLAFVIVYSLSRLKLQRNLARNIVIVAFSILLVFLFNRKVSDFQIKNAIYFLVTILGLAFFYFSQELKLQKRLYTLMAIGIISAGLLKLSSLGPYFIKALLYLILFISVYLAIFTISGLKLKRDFGKVLGFIVLSLLLSAFILSFAVSGRNMGIAFDSVWSPETVKVTSDYIKMNSKEGDEVLSGAVIWELQSNRRPFMNQTHPLVYMHGVFEEELKDINQHLSDWPPRFIVLDGYTEQTYLSHVNKLQTVIEEKYQLEKVVNGSRHPVKIYKLKDG